MHMTEITDVLQWVEKYKEKRRHQGKLRDESDYLVGALAAIHAVFGSPENPSNPIGEVPVEWYYIAGRIQPPKKRSVPNNVIPFKKP